MSAAVDKIEEKRKPEDFIGHRKRDSPIDYQNARAACGRCSKTV